MITIAIIVVLVVSLYLYGTRTHGYWAKKGVVHVKPIPIFGTDMRRFLLRRSMTDTCSDTYWQFPGERFVGRYRGSVPELVIRDPELIKHVILTDFKHFYSRGIVQSHVWLEPLLRNMFFADGDLWRLLRQLSTSAFSSGKLKAMFPLIVERAEKLQGRALAASGRPLDARDLMARYATDFIGACGFGLDADSLNQDYSEFRKLGAKILVPTLRRAVIVLCKITFPNLFKYSKLLEKEIEDDITYLTKQIRNQRGNKHSGRNDFIDSLIESQAKGKISVESLEKTKEDGSPETVELELDDLMIAAQVLVFFVAGFETSSSSTSFTLHELAYHPEVQRKVQADVDRALARHGGKLSYDAVQDMTYLEWTFKESMRVFPSVGFLMRQCERSYTLPGTNITLDPGVKITIPLQALHNDPLYFDNPQEFRPERFAPEQVEQWPKFVYLPFGGGPRSCIGGRLGLMQSLAGLAAIMSKFTVSPAPESRRHLLRDPTSSIVQAVIGGIPLIFTERKQINTFVDNDTSPSY